MGKSELESGSPYNKKKGESEGEGTGRLSYIAKTTQWGYV